MYSLQLGWETPYFGTSRARGNAGRRPVGDEGHPVEVRSMRAAWPVTERTGPVVLVSARVHIRETFCRRLPRIGW